VNGSGKYMKELNCLLNQKKSMISIKSGQYTMLTFTYCIDTEGLKEEFIIEVDEAEMSLVTRAKPPFPRWTELTYEQCDHCPLRREQTSFCPVAVNLVPLIGLSAEIASYQKISVKVITGQRTVSAVTTAQRVLGSMLGLIMATSPCPHLAYLKPMARFHLPLADPVETVYRAITMYLLAQFFKNEQGHGYNFDFSGLQQIYRNLQIINKHQANRIRAAMNQDAAVNGIILLDVFSREVFWSIEEGLGEMRNWFSAYLCGK
jgi:hypothetical protein